MLNSNFEHEYQEFQKRLFELDHQMYVELNNKYYKLAMELIEINKKQFVGGEKTPLPKEKIQELEEFCRSVKGYKLDDFPPGSCKVGTRRKSETNILGPFTLDGYSYYEKLTDGSRIAYIQVEIKDGRYKSQSTQENASACIGRGEIPGSPEGSWNLIVRKGIGTPDINQYRVAKDHNDDFGNHAEIAASDMCNQMCSFIYEHLTN